MLRHGPTWGRSTPAAVREAGCGTCEARAAETSERLEGGASAPTPPTRYVSSHGAGPADDAEVLVGSYSLRDGATHWTVTRQPRRSIHGFESSHVSGAVLQIREGEEWVTRLWIPSTADGLGLRSLPQEGRVVFLEASALEEVAIAPPGFELNSARSSADGVLPYALTDTSITPRLALRDSLMLSFRPTSRMEKPGGDYFLLVRSGPRSSASHGRQARTTAPPAEFALDQNHPNPFIQSTRLSFTIPHAGLVTLDIYDMQGRRVRRLAEDRFAAGRHEVVWDRRTVSGLIASPGVYYYRLAAGGHRAERRMVLLP